MEKQLTYQQIFGQIRYWQAQATETERLKENLTECEKAERGATSDRDYYEMKIDGAKAIAYKLHIEAHNKEETIEDVKKLTTELMDILTITKG